MTIAVHIDLTDQQNDHTANFNYTCFSILAAGNPGHHFIFIFDRPFKTPLITEKNITPVLIGPQIKNRLLQHYFYNFKIPRVLNKYHADFFISTDTCSLRTTVPQCLIIHDLSFFQKNNLFAKSDVRYLKRYTKFFIKKSALVIVLNAELKKTLVGLFPAAENKISVTGIGIDDTFSPIGYDKADAVREQLTEGKQYFVFFATETSVANIITMLKSFSIFKKWQKSNMQLLILSSATQNKNMVKELSNYKYRGDVAIIPFENTETTATFLAAAYAAIHLPCMEITETEGLHTLACAVPLITTDTDFSKSIYKDGALYAATNEKEISEKMMLLYKDEKLRNAQVQKGNAIAATHRWQNSAADVWRTLQPDKELTLQKISSYL